MLRKLEIEMSEDKLREQFEAWFNEYQEDRTNEMWFAWQACAKIKDVEIEELKETLFEIQSY